MRIYNNRLYAIGETPGISGFQSWHKTQVRIVTGYVARRLRSSIIGEFDATDTRSWYRLDDGHLPGHQPITNAAGVIAYLTENVYSAAYELVERDRM